ncbi:MAG: CsbD family protein [Alphaproteobacteria bacterium]|nr:CsbD family protein [Alphaproteobacteria bacterium]
MKKIVKISTVVLLVSISSNFVLAATQPQEAPTNSSQDNKTSSILPVVNEDILQGRWDEIKGKMKKQWGKITDDDLLKVEGSLQELHGILQQKYGYDKDKAEKEVKKFLKDNGIELKK